MRPSESQVKGAKSIEDWTSRPAKNDEGIDDWTSRPPVNDKGIEDLTSHGPFQVTPPMTVAKSTKISTTTRGFRPCSEGGAPGIGLASHPNARVTPSFHDWTR